MKKFIAVGDNCVDEYINMGTRHAGGCSVNFSVYMGQLNEKSAYLGVVGTDSNADVIENALVEYGVDADHLKRQDGITAVTKVSLINNERHFISYDEGVLKNFSLSEEDLHYIQGFDYMHTSVYGNILKELPRLTGKIKIIFDFAYKFKEQRFLDIVPFVDYGFLSYNADDQYIRSILVQFHHLGCNIVTATLGDQGSLSYDGNQFYRKEADNVMVVDTLGAGDSFIAGFMAAEANGSDIPTCMEHGAQKADETIGMSGAF